MVFTSSCFIFILPIEDYDSFLSERKVFARGDIMLMIKGFPLSERFRTQVSVMISKHQFEQVSKLVDSGVTNYVQIRQQVGLTSDQLNDILENVEYYNEYFAEQERKEKEQLAEEAKKKKRWWQKN